MYIKLYKQRRLFDSLDVNVYLGLDHEFDAERNAGTSSWVLDSAKPVAYVHTTGLK